MRTKSKALYIVAIPQGISGFRKAPIPALVTGARLRRDLLDTWSGSLGPIEQRTYRLEDGHLPDYQERGDLNRATAFLAENPFQAAYFV